MEPLNQTITSWLTRGRTTARYFKGLQVRFEFNTLRNAVVVTSQNRDPVSLGL